MKNILPTSIHLFLFTGISHIKEGWFSIKRMYYSILTLFFVFFCTNLSAQITTTSGLTANDYVEMIIGQGIEYSNAQILGTSTQIATYTGGASAGMQPTMNSGIVMGTGPVNNPTTLHGPASKQLSTSMNTSGFQELNTLAGISTTRDGIGLQFNFIPLTDKLKINFQFGSEEYNEWVNTNYNDVFGFFISGPGIGPLPGQNIALAPGGVRVALNSINRGDDCPANPASTAPPGTICGIGSGNCASNPMYYINNCTGVYNNAMDGFTVMLTAEATVIPCEEYTIRLLLADGSDTVYDSWVFLQESGFYADGTIVEAEVTHIDPEMDFIYEGCSGSEVSFCIPKPLTTDYVVPITWSGGTATWGVDHLPLPSTITIPAGETCTTIPVVALNDGITEGIETIIGEYPKDTCNVGEIIIEINDSPLMTVEFDIGDIEQCYDPDNEFILAPVVMDNVGSDDNLIYVWNDGVSDFSTDSSISVNPEVDTTYTVTVMDVCGQVGQASISIVIPDEITPVFSLTDTYCLNASPDILPTTSDNGLVGVWSPSVIDTSSFGVVTYTFTPDEG